MSDEPSSSQEDEERRSDDEPESREPDRDDAEEEEDERKPISVRDLMPPSSSEGRRPAPERGGPPEGTEGLRRSVGEEEDEEEPAEREGSGEDEASRSRPTPVRVAMDAPPPGDSRPARELPSRRFEVRGEEWIARITGRTVTGTRPDPGAHLMHLTFYRSADPERPIRELLTVERPLDALYEQDLEEFLDRSRPAREPFEAD